MVRLTTLLVLCLVAVICLDAVSAACKKHKKCGSSKQCTKSKGKVCKVTTVKVVKKVIRIGRFGRLFPRRFRNRHNVHKVKKNTRWNARGRNFGVTSITFSTVFTRPKRITGRRGNIRWRTTYKGHVRFIIFRFKNLVKRYQFPVGGKLRVKDFLSQFRQYVKVTNKSKTEAVTSEIVEGQAGNIFWSSVWNTKSGKIAFFLKEKEDGKWVTIETRSYQFTSSDPDDIEKLLAKFKADIKYGEEEEEEEEEPTPEEGANVNYKTDFANGEGTITFHYQFVQDGEIVKEFSQTYDLTRGDQAEINAFAAEFNAYIKSQTTTTSTTSTMHTTVETIPPVLGKIVWETKFVDGKTIFIAEYVESQGDKVVRTLKKEYPMTKTGDEGVTEILEQFKADLQAGKV